MPLDITTTQLGDWTEGLLACQAVQASGDTAPVTFSVLSGCLPKDLKIDPASGIISGVPKRQGIYSFTVRAADSSTPPQVATRLYTIIVSASTTTKIWFASVLAAFTVLVVMAMFAVFGQVEMAQPAADGVFWANEKSLKLKPGPATFWFDQASKKLRYRGIVNDVTKKQLLDLVEGEDPAYREAINELAFRSTQAVPSRILWLLGLAGLAGVIGVQLRSLHDFVGNCCYKRQLDTLTWWPWYFLRPLLGFLLGSLVIALFKSDLLTVNRTAEESSVWWFGLATLAGFGEIDVFKRLRLLSGTMFGSERTPPSSKTE